MGLSSHCRSVAKKIKPSRSRPLHSSARWMIPQVASSSIEVKFRPQTLCNARTLATDETSSSSYHPSSRRALSAVQLLPSYLADARSVQQYHPTDAPDGALQLGVAESKMLEDLLVPALNMPIDIPSDCIYYQQTHGRLSCRESMSSYLENLLNLPKNSLYVDGLVLGSGCNAVLENLCLCLAEPGEAVMIPTPYYAAFEFDLVARANLHVHPVPTQDYSDATSTESETASSSNSSVVSGGGGTERQTIDPSIYYPTAAALTAAYNEALHAGHVPRILLLSHPHNPLGICYPKHVIEECIEWCRSNKVHLVSDEIYAGSVYNDSNSGFHSTLQVAADEHVETKGLGLGPYVHWVYAMSKDFALSGLRVGVAYSENQAIRLPMQKLNDLCQISSQTQVWVESLMNKRITENGDKGPQLWVQQFREENHRRLRARCDALTKCLEDCNIPYLQPTSGLFCWIDLSAYLPLEGSNAERERALYLEMIQKFGLLLTPGNSMRNEEPGFFRIVFTAASDHEFALGLQRLRHFADVKQRT
ncbi:hypothetical protein ACA910_000957 [Epithemia clementina (nom. ined.)]